MNAISGKNLEESLAKHYRQPKGIEQFGIEVIPPDLRTVRWWDLFVIVINFLLNPGRILVGGLAVASGLSFWAMIVSEVVGTGLAFIIFIIMATVGVDYGIPGQVATRMVYGIRGSKWVPSLMRTLSSVYYFAFQTLAGALAISAVLEQILHHSVSLVTVSLIFAIFQVFIATVGYQSLKVLSRYAFVLKLIFTVVIFGIMATSPITTYHPSSVFSFVGKEGWKWTLMIIWINAAAATWFSMVTDAADFCRYSKTRVDMWIGTLVAAMVGQFLSAFLGGYAVAATLAKNKNPFDVMAKAANNSLWILGLILLYVVLDNWTINVVNLYTGGLSLSNIIGRLGRFWSTLIISALGVVLSLFPEVVNGYVGYMSIVGNIFGPIAGVLLVHYVVFVRGKIDVAALFIRRQRYWYWGGFNWVAIACTIIGFIISAMIPSTWMTALFAVVVTGGIYWLALGVLRKYSSALAQGSEPAESLDLDILKLDKELIEGYTI
ncbi:MAG: purine-cytosine permease family protein [Desulfitobacteriaceae bacterium]